MGLVWKGILLGLGAAAPIGPVNVEIARRALRHGFGAGVLLGLGAVTVDVTYAVLASLGLRLVLDRAPVRITLSIAGAALLAYLGVQCLRSAFRPAPEFASDEPEPEIRRPRSSRHYLTGLLMTSLNPMTLAFWFVVLPGLAGQLSADPAGDLPWICAGVFVGALSWVLFFASFITVAGNWERRKVAFLADLAGGVMLLGFAASSIWRMRG
jgi:L-lysine exporter family protein LysE/ArgO